MSNQTKELSIFEIWELQRRYLENNEFANGTEGLSPLPCPFCGNKDILVMEDDEHKGTWNVYCHGDTLSDNCGAYQEGWISEIIAIQRWNTRHPLSKN